MKLVTHNGFCHADDVLACAVLSTLFPVSDLVRSRDFVQTDEDFIMFDVGMKYDGVQFFDHHQKDKELRHDGIPYSSFGLIWKHFGTQFLALVLDDDKHLQEVWDYIDQSFVRLIDIGDNGVQTDETHLVTNAHSFSKLLCVSHDGSDESFKQIVNFARNTLMGLCDKANRYHQDIELFGNGLLIDEDRILLLSKTPRDFSPVNLHPNKDTITYIISPREEGKWQVNTFRIGAFGNRLDLYPPAAGLVDEELVAATEIPDLVFCHTAKFIGVGKTKESVLAFARLSLQY